MPAARTVHIDRLATAVAEAYRNQRFEYIADIICPPFKVQKKSDLFPKWPLETFFRRPTKKGAGIKRAPSTPFARRDYDVGSGNYVTEQYGIEHPLDDTTKQNADEAFRVEVIPTELLTEDILREKEIRVAALLTNTANLTQNVTLVGADKWTDVGSDIVAHFEDGANAVKEACGRLPNLISIPRKVWRYAKHHPALLERLKYKDRTAPVVQPANLEEIFSGSFDPNTKILFPSAVYETGSEGQAVGTLTPIWGNDVVMGYVDPNPQLGKPTLCHAPEFMPFAMMRYRDENVTSDIFRAMEDRDELLFDAKCGYLIKAAI